MKQVIQNLRTGEIKVEEVPIPAIRAGFVLVKTFASLISAGTEKAKVQMGEKNLLQKALARPDLTKQVLMKIRQEGIISTYNKIMHRLDSWSALGYSCAGRIVGLGENVFGFNIGDRVACAGSGYANHAEFVCVPVNLVAKVPVDVDFEQACFTTLGAISLQGIRQAEVKLGENICVIGLGLLGQITVGILASCGCNVFGIDVDLDKVRLSEQLGAKKSVLRTEDIESLSYNFTDGFGFDGVIITAASSDNDPLIIAGEITRDKGRVVIVGDVKIDIPRKNYYEKELQVFMSRSYGPGRYDQLYEERGIDYPIGYVRWTEQRNMQAFLELLNKKSVNLKPLITHRFGIENVIEAYDLLSDKRKESYLGIILKYNTNEEEQISKVFSLKREYKSKGSVKIGFIGAGNFASGVLLPILRKIQGAGLIGICSASGLSAKNAAKRFGFKYAASSPEDILGDKDIDVVFIVTTHNLHAELAIKSLNAGKITFVEKPLAITKEELEKVIKIAQDKPYLMVGFNRRFSPHTSFIKSYLSKRAGGCVINCRVNAGKILADSWMHNLQIGGGRIIGEACHFADLLQYLVGEEIEEIFATSIQGSDPDIKFNDNVVVNLKFKDGSIGSIVYTSKGDVNYGKENIEVFSEGISMEIEDFKISRVYKKGNCKTFKTFSQDKGHKNELMQFINAVRHAKTMPIPLEDIYNSSLATFFILDSLRNNRPFRLNEKS